MEYLVWWSNRSVVETPIFLYFCEKESESTFIGWTAAAAAAAKQVGSVGPLLHEKKESGFREQTEARLVMQEILFRKIFFGLARQYRSLNIFLLLECGIEIFDMPPTDTWIDNRHTQIHNKVVTLLIAREQDSSLTSLSSSIGSKHFNLLILVVDTFFEILFFVFFKMILNASVLRDIFWPKRPNLTK